MLFTICIVTNCRILNSSSDALTFWWKPFFLDYPDLLSHQEWWFAMDERKLRMKFQEAALRLTWTIYSTTYHDTSWGQDHVTFNCTTDQWTIYLFRVNTPPEPDRLLILFQEPVNEQTTCCCQPKDIFLFDNLFRYKLTFEDYKSKNL